MNGYRFYADLPGTHYSGVTGALKVSGDKWRPRTTVAQLTEYAAAGGLCNVIALLLGDEHKTLDGCEALVSTFEYQDSDTSLSSVSREYLRKCRRIPESLARELHPRLFARIDAAEIADLKEAAWKANEAGDWRELRAICRRLEKVWKDDHAAKAFYTELEAAAADK